MEAIEHTMNQTQPSPLRSLVLYFVLAFALTWAFWAVPVLASAGAISTPFPHMAWVIVGAHGPLAAAFALTWAQGGRPAAGRLLRRGFDLRLRPLWWAAVLLTPFLLAGLAVWANGLIDGAPENLSMPAQPLGLLGIFVFNFVVGGSVQEEFGWRGYALPRLLERRSPFAATLILGTVWGLWHLPLFFIAGIGQAYMPVVPFLLLAVGFSFPFTWFYLKTGRSLFSALLLHAAINTSLNAFPVIDPRLGRDQPAFLYLLAAYAVAALILVLSERRWWFRRKPLAL